MGDARRSVFQNEDPTPQEGWEKIIEKPLSFNDFCIPGHSWERLEGVLGRLGSVLGRLGDLWEASWETSSAKLEALSSERA